MTKRGRRRSGRRQVMRMKLTKGDRLGQAWTVKHMMVSTVGNRGRNQIEINVPLVH